MAVTITCTPASPVAKKDFCRLDVAGASTNRADHSEYRYYLTFENASSEILGKSYVFNVSSAGLHSFNNYIMPTTLVTKVVLHDKADNSVVKSQAITVS